MSAQHGVDWSKFPPMPTQPETKPSPGIPPSDNKGDNMSSKETLSTTVDALIAGVNKAMDEQKAEVLASLPVTPVPVDPNAPPVEMIPKADALKMVADARVASFAEGKGAGVEETVKAVNATVGVDVAKLQSDLAALAPTPVTPAS